MISLLFGSRLSPAQHSRAATTSSSVLSNVCRSIFSFRIVVFLKFLLFIIAMGGASLSFGAVNTSSPPNGYVPNILPIKSLAVKANADEATDILLVQTALPWGSDANTQVLDQLGYNYDIIDMSNIQTIDIAKYRVVLVVNDQDQAFYDNYANNYLVFEEYVKTGGTLVFFAADQGWAGGNNYTDLPGGVMIGDSFQSENIISSPTNSIITGSLTQNLPISYRDGSLTNSDLVGNFASHNYFPEPLPPETEVVLRGKTTGEATLIIYPLEKGKVIASGLTWEYTYSLYAGISQQYGFGRALPDVFMYAFNVANIFNTPPVANDDDATTEYDTPVTINVLSNDVDEDGDTITISTVDSASLQGGSIKNNDDGTVTYTPKAGFVGVDSFGYSITDGNEGSDSATVSITVNNLGTMFINKTNVQPDVTVESNKIKISGLSAESKFSISGGEYSLNGSPYTKRARGTIKNGDIVQVRHTSSKQSEKSVTTTFILGKTKLKFTSTTLVFDISPESVSFTEATGVAPATLVESNIITVTGINVPIDISVANGEYRINGGDYIKKAGVVKSGDTVQVRHRSSNRSANAVETTLKLAKTKVMFKSTTATF